MAEHHSYKVGVDGSNPSGRTWFMGNIFITFGLILILLGFLIKIFPTFPLLPGDILVKKENFTFYFPLTTSILISIILSVIFFLLNR